MSFLEILFFKLKLIILLKYSLNKKQKQNKITDE
jgi:hypothetical protein